MRRDAYGGLGLRIYTSANRQKGHFKGMKSDCCAIFCP